MPSESINAYNVTQAVSLGSIASDANSVVPQGSFTGGSVAVGDVVEFSHGTYPETVRCVLQATQEEAYFAIENDISSYVVENLFTSTTNSRLVDIYAQDLDNLSAPIFRLGGGKAGTVVDLPYVSGVEKNLRIFPISLDEKLNPVRLNFDTTNYQDVVVTPSGIAIGTAVTGGGANRVLFEDGSQNLAADADFIFDGATNTLTVAGMRAWSTGQTTSTYFGNGAGKTSANAQNTGFGYLTGAALTSGYNNCFFGDSTGSLVADGQANSFFGHGAGASCVSGIANTFVGANAGNAYTGSSGTMVGFDAGAIATGAANTFVGSQAGRVITTGTDCTFLGAQAGFTATGAANTFLGSSAGYTDGTGSHNVAVGFRAGYSNSTGTRNVFLGTDAGYYETGSHKLWVANIYNDHLIYGEFDNHIVRVNGRLGALATTEQMRLEYDASNYFTVTVSSTGVVTFDAVGSGAKFVFSDDTEVNGRVSITKTTEQLRIGYDASNYLSLTLDANANATFNLTAGAGTPKFIFSDKVDFSDDVTIADAKNIILNTTTGTKIGTATTQKLGFFNATPVTQRTNIGTATYGSVAGSDTVDLALLNDTLSDLIDARNAIEQIFQDLGLTN